MKDHYIPEAEFPIVLTPKIRVLGNYFFNLILVTGTQESALFETGISGVTDAVIRQLENIGVAPDYLIVSHPHADHITGLPGLVKRFPKARVVAGIGANAFVTHPKAGPALIKEDKFMSQGLVKMGISPGRSSLESIPDLGRAQEIAAPTLLDLGGGVDLELIPVHGHSPANLMGRVRCDQALFCSDSLGFHYPGRALWPLFFTNAKAYVDSLDLIRSFNPKILCPAHQGPILGDEAAKGIDQARAFTLSTISRINQTKMKDPDLIQALFEESYKDEFTLYTEENILNCTRLLIKRARE
ncbi:MAG: MBL fold metallo-hydrolase [Desulfobacter sp.]|nr:MBL fold metallo-hydrolase [Desulfobacter sp.]WDP85352.1 MAG: MBL fold metallo-hydrolase [Desulfobacter sp.]